MVKPKFILLFELIYDQTFLSDVFLPCPDNLLVNLKECRELINDLLQQLPKRFANEHDNKSALGAALQAAFKLMVSAMSAFVVSTIYSTFVSGCNGRTHNSLSNLFA